MIVPAQTLEALRPIQPFHLRSKAFGLTFGLSPAGYDVRINETMWVWKGLPIRLASTIERFDMPENMLAQVCDKSTWVRRGVFVHNTVIEPGWEGYLTLEIASNAWTPIKIQSGMPIAQIIFWYLSEPTRYPYSGKYQNQRRGPQKAILE